MRCVDDLLKPWVVAAAIDDARHPRAKMGRRRHARAIVGSTVRDTLTSPSPAPTTRPLALVESGQRLTHQLRPGAAPRSEPDESTPTSGRNCRARRARPAGGLGAELWVKLVDATEPAPTNPAALVFLTMTTTPTFRALVQARRRRGNWGGPPSPWPARSTHAARTGRGASRRRRRVRRTCSSCDN